jgi:hypothetical protein
VWGLADDFYGEDMVYFRKNIGKEEYNARNGMVSLKIITCHPIKDIMGELFL